MQETSCEQRICRLKQFVDDQRRMRRLVPVNKSLVTQIITLYPNDEQKNIRDSTPTGQTKKDIYRILYIYNTVPIGLYISNNFDTFHIKQEMDEQNN